MLSYSCFCILAKVSPLIYTMSDFVERIICIKLCLPNEYFAADTLRMLQKAFGDEVMSQKNCLQIVQMNC